ncbi:MAG: exo-alpha-sialidase [Ruminococcaceae bacterium]|nr:exo-alpha-sialidase [Oscillospiraceae bacterium]
MPKNAVIYKAVSVVLTLTLVLSALVIFTACGKKEDEDPTKKKNDVFIDLSSYSLIRYDRSKNSVVDKTAQLKIAIEDELNVTLSIQSDWYNPNNAPDPNAKEILVDKTNRKESTDALAKLEEKENDAFIIDITENKIVILGKTESSTVRAIAYFIENYVLASAEEGKIDILHGKTVIKDYTSVMSITIGNKLDIDVEIISDVFVVPDKGYVNVMGYLTQANRAHYPSVLELKYQPNKENNGKLIGTFCLGDTPVNGGPNTQACVMESSDGGKTWEVIARPDETIDTSIKGISMAHIYELPAQLGDMPAGTLLYSGNSVNYSRKSHIAVWRSFDCGYTWEEYVIIAEGGGTKEGVWEPFMWYEPSDGYLYCFYSDDSDPRHDQKLVYKRSKDGKNWSDIVDVCTFNDPADRPGMFVMTKMGNGEYFMVYEYYGSKNGYVYYKTTKDITSWNPTDPGKQIFASGSSHTIGSSPSCIWTRAGGKHGTLIVTGKWEEGGDGKHRMFVSFDYGKTWETMENPLTYDLENDILNTNRTGHSASLVVGSDPYIIYYMNTTDVPETGRQRIQFAKLKIN